MKFPTTSGKGIIWKARQRMISLIVQMQKIIAGREKTKAKGKAKVGPKEAPAAADDVVEVDNLEEELMQVNKITEAKLKLKLSSSYRFSSILWLHKMQKQP